MKPYKKHLLQSAFDLQSRLNGQVQLMPLAWLQGVGSQQLGGLIHLVWHEKGPSTGNTAQRSMCWQAPRMM